MWNDTEVTQLLGIEYPIIQGPFGGRFSSAKLTAAVSNLGGMGSFGLNAYAPDEIIEVNYEIKSQTRKPYALNLWVPLDDDPAPDFSQSDFEKVREAFKPYFDQVNIPVPRDMKKEVRSFEAQVEAILAVEPPVMSFIYGIPHEDIIEALKARNIIVMAVATSVEEAIVIEAAGFDIVIASGKEAGGHRASFLADARESLTSTAQLVREVREKTKIPVIAAGGISTGVDIMEMLKSGAGATQLGTAFLATEESNVSEEHRKRLLDNGFETSLTRVFSGRLARVMTTDFVRVLEHEAHVAPYPIQSNFLSSLRKEAQMQDRFDFEAFWAGEPSTTLRHKSVSDLFQSLIEEVMSVS